MTVRDDVVIGICRSCTRQRLLFLPARICGRCIEKAMAIAKEQSEAALIAALSEDLGDDSRP